MLNFTPTVMLKGDYVGHPFRGNQWGNPNDITDADRQAAGIPKLNDVFDGPVLVASNGYKAVKEDELQKLGNDSGLWDAMGERIMRIDDSEEKPTDQLDLLVVDNYVDTLHGKINDLLRGIPRNNDTVLLSWPSSGHIVQEIATTEVAEAMDEAFDKYDIPLPESAILYRGIGGKTIGKFTSLQIGQEFTDKGFISTSIDPRTANVFIGGGPDFGAIIEIHAPKGTPVMLPDPNGARGEGEMVLNRGTKFRVTHITSNHFAGRHRDVKLIVEVVLEDKAA